MSFSQHYQMVKEFHVAFDQPVDMPLSAWKEQQRSGHRDLLYTEEADEFVAALEANDKMEMLDAIVDRMYIAVGTLVELESSEHTYDLIHIWYGKYAKCLEDAQTYLPNVDVNAAFEEVHRSNMDKLVDGKPLLNGINIELDDRKPRGKVMKPKGWQPPKLDVFLTA